MDGCRVRPYRAVTPRKPDQLEDSTRSKLGLSEKRNGVPLVCYSRMEISSRFKSSTAAASIQDFPRRSQNPTFDPKSNVQERKLLRRSQSADRRRPSNHLPACSRPLTPSYKSSTPRHLLVGRTLDGFLLSMKSLSLSFGLNSSKNAVSERKWTPQSRKTCDHSENARPVEDLHGRTADQARSLGLSRRNLSAASSKSNSLITPSRRGLHRRIHDSHVSDKGHKQLRSELERRVTFDCNGKSNHESCMSLSSPNLCSFEKALPVMKSTMKSSSPISSSLQVTSTNKASSVPFPTLKGNSGPFSASNSKKSGVCSTQSVLNYTVQVRKGKQSTKCIEDAHQLRMLYNRYLQWRFVNGRADDVLSVQRIKAETTLNKMENDSSELCDPIIQNSIYMQHMKQNMKLNMLLKEQITYLEDWSMIENEHFLSISGTIRALEASTLWIPVTGGSRADITALKNAINSAVDAMQAMGSSIYSLSSKVHQISSLISDLLASARKERSMLDDCADLLSFARALQVQDASLRGNIIQLGQVLCK